MLTTTKPPSLWRTLAIALTGLLLPFLWPGVLRNLLDTAQFTLDQHDLHWPTALTILHVGSDLVIGVAYTVISSILAFVVYQNRRSLPFDWVVLSFGLFIIACGLMHFMHVLVRFQPVYWLDGYVRALTAIVSIATAAALPPLVPRVRQLLNAERLVTEQQRELQATNTALREAVSRAEVLATLGDALQATSTAKDAASITVERLAPALNASALLVVFADEHQPPVRWGSLPEQIRQLIAQPALNAGYPSIQAQLAHSRTAVYFDQCGARDGGEDNLRGYALGIEPILAPDGRLVGYVEAWREARHGEWTSGQRDLIRRAAATVGLALERTRSVEETVHQRDALQTANTLLSQSNAELEAFARVASHDLQEPLRTIASFSELVNRRYGDALDENGQKYLGLITRSAEHMKDLIRDLLAYSRLSSVREPAGAIALAATFDEAVLRLQGAIEQSGARVTSDSLPLVQGHAGELTQVLQNLLGNAIKFSRPGVTPEVHVSAQSEGAEWHVTVRDNGTGIESQYAERVFEMFQRLHSREQYEGTGLGLAIVRKIIERHGGRVWLESEPGLGTTVHFTLRKADEVHD